MIANVRRLRIAGALVLAGALASPVAVGAAPAHGKAKCPVNALDKATEPVEITMWHAMVAANMETLEALANEFNASQDRVRVNLVLQGSYDSTLTKFIANLDGGDLPNIAQLEESAVQIGIDTGVMVPAGTCVKADDYDTSGIIERVTSFFTVDGTLWPMPFNVSNPVLYYNAGAFERAGLDPTTPPATLADLEEYSRQIVDSGAASSGFTFDLDPWYLEQWFGKSGALLYDHANGREGRATKTLIDGKTGRAYFEFFERMHNDGLLLNSGADTTAAFTAFATGETAMVIASSAAMGGIFAAVDGGQFPATTSVAVGPLPALPGKGGVPVGGGGMWIVGEDKSPEEIAASWEFLKFLVQPAQQAAWHLGTGYIPIRESAADQPEVQARWDERPQFRVPFDQLLAGTTNRASAGAAVGPYKEVRDIYRKAWERLFVSDADAKKVLADAERDANDVIDDYNRRLGS